MTFRLIFALSLMAAGGIAAAAEPSPGTSPMDKNQACMDRTVDASAGDCVIKDEGTPRHTYPSKRPAQLPTQKPAQVAPSATIRGSSAGK